MSEVKPVVTLAIRKSAIAAVEQLIDKYSKTRIFFKPEYQRICAIFWWQQPFSRDEKARGRQDIVICRGLEMASSVMAVEPGSAPAAELPTFPYSVCEVHVE